MAISITTIKCPECGASLPIEEDRKLLFCSYCGSKLMITDENEYTFRHIDEAEIKHEETERVVKLKTIAMKEKQAELQNSIDFIKVVASIVLGVIGVICIGIAYVGDEFGFAMPGMVCLLILMYIWIFSSDKKEK